MFKAVLVGIRFEGSNPTVNNLRNMAGKTCLLDKAKMLYEAIWFVFSTIRDII